MDFIGNLLFARLERKSETNQRLQTDKFKLISANFFTNRDHILRRIGLDVESNYVGNFNLGKYKI